MRLFYLTRLLRALIRGEQQIAAMYRAALRDSFNRRPF